MGKKLKLNLDALKVKSFVTSINDEQQEQVRAGEASRWTKCSYPALCSEESCPEVTCTCPTNWYTCQTCTTCDETCLASCSCDTMCP